MKAAIVDVDGTLLRGPHSSEALFIRHLLKNRVLGLRQLAAAGWFLLTRAPVHGRHVFRRNKVYLAGLKLADIAAIAEAFVASDLEPLIDRAVLCRMEEHRAAGDRVLLLTGTPDFLAKPLVRRVAADGWRGARYAVREGRFVAAPAVAHPLGVEKITAALDLCGEHGCELSEAAAYADSRHDIALLEKVARPVAVCPDAVLARTAAGRGWEIMAETQETDGRVAAGKARHA